ncbi:MAG: hypothetical protein HY586_01305, partial [Candidatus Omnitrophica bacterium]|nr:hypothetical protein [Candidatus Omnitrophota bacterium]
MKLFENKKFIRFSALFFSIYFTLFSIISNAYAQEPVGGRGPLCLSLPSELGRISDSYFPSVHQKNISYPGRPSLDPPCVIHIQDAHGQTRVQENIAKILEYLAQKEGVNALFLEGGFAGPVSHGLLRFFKEESLNQKIAGDLLEEGIISGSGVFLLKSGRKIRAYGIETEALYRDNVKAYQEVVRRQNESDVFLFSLRNKILSYLDPSPFRHRRTRRGGRAQDSRGRGIQGEGPGINPELAGFVRNWLRFQESRLGALGQLDKLESYARKFLKVDFTQLTHQFDYPGLARYFSIRRNERKVIGSRFRPKIERDLERLKKWLIQHEFDSGYAGIFEALSRCRLSPLEASYPVDVRLFLEHFYAEAKPKGFSFSDYYTLMKYLGLLLLAQEMEAGSFFEEIKKLNHELVTALAKTPEEKGWVELLKDYVLVKKLFALELSRTEYSEVLEKQKILSPEIFSARITLAQIDPPLSLEGAGGVRVEAIAEIFRESLRFYQLASKRENALFTNMMAVLEKAPRASRVALITGGFHSEGLESLIKGEGLSYVKVTPTATEIESGEPYAHQMMMGASTVPAVNIAINTLPEIERVFGRRAAEFHRRQMRGAVGRRAPPGTKPDGPAMRLHGWVTSSAQSLGAAKWSEISEKARAQYMMSAHINGLTVIPALYVLASHGVFDELFGRPEDSEPAWVSVMDIARRYNTRDPEKNLGNLWMALDNLARHGWLRRRGVDEQAQYAFTEQGWAATELVRSRLAIFRDVFQAIRDFKNYHSYFRGPPSLWRNVERRRRNLALGRYKRFIEWSRQGWNLPEGKDYVEQRVRRQMRRLLDGMLMCPTMAALGMPRYESRFGPGGEKETHKILNSEIFIAKIDSIVFQHAW